MPQEREVFELYCHCRACEDCATVLIAGDAVGVVWQIRDLAGVALLTAPALARALTQAEFDFAGGASLAIDFNQADRLRAWLAARGVGVPQAVAP